MMFGPFTSHFLTLNLLNESTFTQLQTLLWLCVHLLAKSRLHNPNRLDDDQIYEYLILLDKEVCEPSRLPFASGYLLYITFRLTSFGNRGHPRQWWRPAFTSIDTYNSGAQWCRSPVRKNWPVPSTRIVYWITWSCLYFQWRKWSGTSILRSTKSIDLDNHDQVTL